MRTGITLLTLMWACSPSDSSRAKATIDLAGYAHTLDECREQGKAAKSYDVYEACAKAADRKYGKESGDGGIP